MPGEPGSLIRRHTLNELQTHSTQAPATLFQPLLSDHEVANLLVMTRTWVRSHAAEIPGFERLGSYFRFRQNALEQWLGSLERLFLAEQVSDLLKVPKSWTYANADEIPGVLHLGRYIRFRPAIINRFLGGSEVAQ